VYFEAHTRATTGFDVLRATTRLAGLAATAALLVDTEAAERFEEVERRVAVDDIRAAGCFTVATAATVGVRAAVDDVGVEVVVAGIAGTNDASACTAVAAGSRAASAVRDERNESATGTRAAMMTTTAPVRRISGSTC
jgi:hypothetical protein